MFRPAIEDDSILLQNRTFLTIHFGALLVIVRLTISERSCIRFAEALGVRPGGSHQFLPRRHPTRKRARLRASFHILR